MKIRPTATQDITGLQTVLDETDLIPSEILPDMFAESGDDALWLTCESQGRAVGFCYAVPEAMADGAWNMLAIAVLPQLQRWGHGAALVARLEATLRTNGARLLIVDTSGAEGFTGTRMFYARIGYDEEARIRDFWAKGDDKVIYRKAL